MRRVQGFTLVEILIVIVIMGVLISFAVVRLSNSTSRGRDEDRVSDVIAITQRLEAIYRTGMTGTVTIPQGSYPTAPQMRVAATRDVIFKDINLSSRVAAGASTATDSIVVPAIGGLITYGSSPATTVDEYAYVPMAVNGSGDPILCETAGCRRFVIRYRLENGGLQSDVRSKNQ